MIPGCESCGADAEVLLDDGSMWCISCDLRARSLGYDNRECVFVLPVHRKGSTTMSDPKAIVEALILAREYDRKQEARTRRRSAARKVARYALWATPLGMVNEGGDGGVFK